MSWSVKSERNWGRLGMKFNWTTTTIDDVCSLVTDGAHNSPKSVEKGYYMASVKDFTEYGFDFSSCRQISEEDYERLRKQGCVPQKDDVLVGKDGARYFEDIIIYKQDERPALLSSIAILRANRKKITPEFLYYTLKTPSIQKDVRDNYGSGSAIPRIVLKDFKRMPFSYPAIDEQQKITAVCSTIDAKIQVNNAINKNLEQQAQAYFNELFVVNAVPTWSECTLSDIGTIVAGGTPSKSKPEYYAKQGIAWITPKDLAVDKSKFISHGANDISELGFSKSSATKMPAGTVLFSSRAPIGYIAIAQNEVTTNQGFKSVVPNENIGTAYVYFLLKNLLPAIEGMASGSTFKEISGTGMKSVPTIMPDMSTIQRFNIFCEPIFKEQEVLEAENHRLSILRDSLFPKLMSGELDISDIDL